jgi:hypothetical protein
MKSLDPHARAQLLFDEAQKLGLDAPTEDMVAEAINTAESEAILHTAGKDAHDRWYGKRLAGMDPVTE